MTNTPECDRKLFITTSCDGESVELRVRDAGTGIPEDNLDRVFHPFVSHGNEGQGLGLGLAISRSIVDAHHGSIRAENNQGGGATFHCRFPLAATVERQRDGVNVDLTLSKASDPE